jgi:hypothetical protein
MIRLGKGAQVEAWFDLFRDSVNLDLRKVQVCMECNICSEINLDAPNGTPR